MSQTIDTLAIEIESNAANSVDGVRKLSRALTSLSKSISSVNGAGIDKVAHDVNSMGSAFAGAGKSTEKARIGAKKYAGILPTITNHTNKAKNSTKSLAYYFGKFYANMFLVIRGAKMLGNAISDTMGYMESFNFWDVAIDSATAKTDEWKELGYEDAEAYAQAFKQGLADFNEKMTGFKTNTETGDISVSGISNLGINLTNLTTFQAEIVSITSSLGLCTQTSNDTSKALSMLVADMSSLKNIDLDTVMANFQSGIIGQSRSLYKYGIDITNATLQTYAYKYGIEKAVSEMTQAEKMQLRLLAILDQSKVAWGDLANTIEQPSNQLRVLTNGVKNLAITIGKILMPMVSATLPYINAMVKALQVFAEWVAKIAGVELNVENTGEGTTDIFEGIEDSADNATESVNALKKSMTQLGIDELNINNPDSSSDGSSNTNNSTSGGIDLSTEISKALKEYEKAWQDAYDKMTDKSTAMADAVVEAFKKKDYKSIGTYISTGITNALNAINWDSVYSVAGQFGSGLAQFLNGAITPEEFGTIGKTVAGALNTALYSINSFGEEFDFNNFGISLATGVNKFFETFDFKETASGLNTWVDNLKVAIAGFLNTLTWEDIIDGVGDFLGELELDTIFLVALGIDFALGANVTKTVVGKAIATAFGKLFGAEAVTFLAGAGGVAGGIALAMTALFTIDLLFLSKTKDENESVGEEAYEREERINATTYVDSESFFDTLELIKKEIDDWKKNVEDKFSKWKSNVESTVETWKTNVQTKFTTWKSNVESTVETWKTNVQTKFTTWKSNVESTVETWKTNVQTKFTTWKSNVESTVETWKTNVQTKFTTWKSNVASTISSWVTNVKDKFTNWKKNIVDKVSSWKESTEKKFSTWKTNVAKTISSWRTNTQDKFKSWKTNVTNTISDWKSTAEGKFTKFKENTQKTISDWYKKIASYFGIDSWSFEGIKDGLSDAFDAAIKAVKDLWNSFAKWINNNLTIKIDTDTIIGKGIKKVLGTDTITLGSLPTFANGGVTSADIFAANENGVPELIGTIGRKSAIASGTEVTGIADAVYSTASEEIQLLREQNALLSKLLNKDLSVNIGDREIARANYRGQKSLGRQLITEF